MSGIKFAIVLACEHTVYFPPPKPKNGDTLFCRMCNGFNAVVSTVAQFNLRCRSCNYWRTCGADKGRAMSLASKHVACKPRHVVEMTNGSEFVQNVGVGEAQGDLFDPRNELTRDERVEVSRSMQSQLRAIVIKPLSEKPPTNP